ncbi:protochlorophyllide reductase [Halopolyspora algeriensis]|uniref:Protochlorophyllide reductase n=1 Tax=Halopolyspora algeriensis TaxID=1500506 RepID=A0A368VU38_9ACTN|nr:oxidoreductase [Halopolyspora algeriensis]RCW44087.1 protochlorophyllide reductase [Halopolyspora algeriensis]TQM53414.1 protochlorophyllide reductase [Halopolyspora algeriensis]
MPTWTEADIPDQSGRTVLITGANSGLGLHSARILAAKGAHLLLACRDVERGRQALSLVAARSTVEPRVIELDLTDLTSVRKAAAEVRERTGDALDVLMNNAGVMATPFHRTSDGFELQIGTNHLGHAALTWLLMPALRNRAGARVVTLSSLAHHGGHLDTGDLNFRRRRYTPVAAYSQSKLANALFALELDRRARHAQLDLTSVAAHPGMSNTELTTNSARQRSLPPVLNRVVGAVTGLVTQPVELGVLPQLCAATAPGVRGGSYFGPSGLAETRGHPRHARLSAAATDATTAARLWEITAELTDTVPDPT